MAKRNQIYQFSDWTSAIRMKNSLNPCLSIDVGIIRDTNEEEILGYVLTVFNQQNSIILYKYNIDLGTPGTWSLTTDEAIMMLNQIGFPCEYLKEEIPLTPEVKENLQTLLNAGYVNISRTVRPAQILVYPADGGRIVPMHKVLAKEYNYFDYRFLDNRPTPIISILDRGIINE